MKVPSQKARQATVNEVADPLREPGMTVDRLIDDEAERPRSGTSSSDRLFEETTVPI
jgi:hypothetical protein